MLDERLIDFGSADDGLIVADGPAIRCRRAPNAGEEVVLRNAGVGRDGDRPPSAIPLLDERLIDGAGRVIGIADGPTVRS